ncbi:MAG: bifunctional pyr operon transcriptional regulator/uracil phosphoribosyltransferase PyrR [Saprospiraceae bacterium]
MDTSRIILAQPQFDLVIDRLCHELIETYDDFADTCIVSIQPRGTPLADRIYKRLIALGVPGFPYGKLDITFYRDDFRRGKPLSASTTEMNLLVENQHVILVDDVLYTGRSVQAALTALNHYGRPAHVELLALVDRRFNRHLPVQPDFTGISIDALEEEYVKVAWGEHHDDEIILYPKKL